MNDVTEIPTLVSPLKNRPASQTGIATGEVDPVPLPDNRYELTGLIASGGMGSVYRARDYVLRRDVAVKIIHDCYADAANIHRFRDEATISAQLQHPGIPPVYDLGDLPDGKPFLAMKLVEGRTLELLIVEDRASVDVAGVFESIAQAIGYAHSRGVIHRDLKPSNVMVGSFGEVQVMDWGLAKVLGATEPSTANSNRTTPGVSSRTLLGCAIGTPSYMPPEQAIGSLDKVNAASDVFGLGGILCAMLTGKATYGGTDADSTRELAAKGELADAYRRLDESGAEPALVALAKRCLSVNPADRPADGNAVAMIVAAMRRDSDERAKQAVLAEAVSRGRARLRNNAAAAVIVILAGGIAVSSWQARRAANAEADTREQLVKTTAAESLAKDRKDEAEASLAIVAERTALALDAYHQFVSNIQNKLDKRPATQTLRRELLEIGRAGLLKIIANSSRHRRADLSLYTAHMHLGDLEQSLGNTTAAAEEYRAGHDIALRLVEDAKTGARYKDDLIVSYSRLGDVAVKLGKRNEALENYQKGLDLTVELLRTNPDNKKAKLYRNAIASRLLETGDGKDSIAFFRRMLESFQELAADDGGDNEYRRNFGAAHIKLGDALFASGHIDDAFKHFQDGEDIFRTIAGEHPEDSECADDLSTAWGRLGEYHSHKNQWTEARKFYEKKRDLSQRISTIDPMNVEMLRALAVSYDKLGTLDLAEKKRSEALIQFSLSAKILKQIAAGDPANKSALFDLATIYDKLGLAAHEADRTAESVNYRQMAYDHYSRLLETEPDRGEYQRKLSGACERLGESLLRTGRPADALTIFERRRVLEESFVKADPENDENQKWLASSLNQLGDTALVLGDRGRAADSYRQALAIRQRLADRDPKNRTFQGELRVSYNRLGNMAVEDGKLNDALEFFTRDLAISEKSDAANSGNRDEHRNHAVSLERLGFISFKLGRWNEARAYWNRFQQESYKLAKADPTKGDYIRLFALSSIRLGEVAHRLGENELADAHFLKGLDLNRQLCQADPKNLQWALDRYSTCEKYALVHNDRHDLPKTVEWFVASRAAIQPWHEQKKLVGPPATYPGIMDGKIAHCRSIIKGLADIDSIFRHDRSKITELVVDCLKERLFRKDWNGALATANRFATWAERQEWNVDDHRYNAASVYALCLVPDESGLDRSLAILRRLKADGYFTAPRIDHLRRSVDFDGVRTHPKFVAFVADWTKPRETAPPPRTKP